jgi:ABC-type spermidine/putrescine transport system permease subunit II
MEAIYESVAIGYFCAIVGGVITLALVYDVVRTRRWRFTLPIAVFLLTVHPAWTVGVRGDCGLRKREVSQRFTAIYLGLLIYQFAVSKRNAPPKTAN